MPKKPIKKSNKNLDAWDIVASAKADMKMEEMDRRMNEWDDFDIIRKDGISIRN